LLRITFKLKKGWQKDEENYVRRIFISYSLLFNKHYYGDHVMTGHRRVNSD
jgi:hypothetical protein